MYNLKKIVTSRNVFYNCLTKCLESVVYFSHLKLTIDCEYKFGKPFLFLLFCSTLFSYYTFNENNVTRTL